MLPFWAGSYRESSWAPPSYGEPAGEGRPGQQPRERRLLQGRIPSWQQELDKEREATGDEDLHTEWCEVIGNLQIEDHKREEIPKGNLHQLEGSRTSSITGSRNCTPLAQGEGGEIQRAARDHLDPHAEERTQ